MTQITKAVLLAGALVASASSAGLAQTPEQPARVFVSVSGGLQAVTRSSTVSGNFVLYDEPGSFTGTRKVKNGSFFDIGGGMHVTGKLSAGVAFTRLVKGANVPFVVT